MAKQFAEADSEALEALVDKYGLSGVVECLENISEGKSAHVASNWQDNSLAKDWSNAARHLRRALNSLALCGL